MFKISKLNIFSFIFIYSILLLPAESATVYTHQGAPVILDPGNVIPVDILHDALSALDGHQEVIRARDRMAVVDFRLPSSKPRFFLVDLMTGAVERFIVAHGRGSDPDNKGKVERLSDVSGSLTSSVGSFVTAGLFQSGKNGPAVFLEGLDLTNRHAREREIIVHSAPYVSPQWLKLHGKPGRSWGCFVIDPSVIEFVRTQLGSGRLLYAGPVRSDANQQRSESASLY